MSEKLPTVAQCERCGRDFVWVNPSCDMIDHYYPANRYVSPKDMPKSKECGGKIVLHASA